MTVPVLEVRVVNKTFGSVVAADNIDVAVQPRERLGLIGTNGAGKTTFVNMVTGHIKPNSGSILLEGVESRATSMTKSLQLTKKAKWMISWCLKSVCVDRC